MSRSCRILSPVRAGGDAGSFHLRAGGDAGSSHLRAGGDAGSSHLPARDARFSHLRAGDGGSSQVPETKLERRPHGEEVLLDRPDYNTSRKTTNTHLQLLYNP